MRDSSTPGRRSERVTLSDGCRLWTESQGAGPPVVFVHGGPGLWDMFGELADALAAGFTTHRWDQRGCGRSPWPGPYALERCLDDVDEVREHFGHERVVLVGHSWGATLALRYTLLHPDRVAGLVYMSGTGLGRGSDVDWRRMRRVMAPYWDRIESVLRSAPSPERDRELLTWRLAFGFADQEQGPACAARLTDPYFPLNRDCEEALFRQTAQFTEEEGAAACCRVGVPTLVVHGTHDDQPPTVTDSLIEALPLARRVLVDGAGHYPWLEQPSATYEAIRAFLAETAATSTGTAGVATAPETPALDFSAIERV